MHDGDWLAQRFEEHRTRLTAVAYRMLGSASEADDAVQEAWIRLSRSDAESIDNLGSWLTTVLSRVCLNILQARRSRPEVPLGPDVPEPAAGPTAGSDPEHEALLADSIGLALLIVLDTLSPAERVAFVLHDMFGVPFEEIAPIVGRNAPAARQLASRARRRVQRTDASGEANRLRHVKLVDAFLAAARNGEFDRLLAYSTPPSFSLPTGRWRRWAPRRRSAAQPTSPGSPGAHAEPHRRSSTERLLRYGWWAGSHASSTASRPAARRSPPSTSSPTRRVCASSTW
jgi:RNA polymerase sigma factor (sigma-70 family)